MSKQESKDKMAEKLKATLALKEKIPAIIYSKVCPVCGKNFDTKIKNQKTCSVKCGKIQGARVGALVKTLRGTHSGWHNRRGEPSYPEKYFISLFEKEKIIGWEREKKVGKWFIDFAFAEIKIAVEIDGRQHEDDERKSSDLLKDIHLKSLGWRVIRIKWFNPKDDNGKLKLYPQIENLKKLIRSSI